MRNCELFISYQVWQHATFIMTASMPSNHVSHRTTDSFNAFKPHITQNHRQIQCLQTMRHTEPQTASMPSSHTSHRTTDRFNAFKPCVTQSHRQLQCLQTMHHTEPCVHRIHLCVLLQPCQSKCLKVVRGYVAAIQRWSIAMLCSIQAC